VTGASIRSLRPCVIEWPYIPISNLIVTVNNRPLYHGRGLFITLLLFCYCWCQLTEPVISALWLCVYVPCVCIYHDRREFEVHGVSYCLISERPEGEWSAGHSGFFNPREFRVPVEYALIGSQRCVQCSSRESNSGRWVGSDVTDSIMTVWSLVGCSCSMITDGWIWHVCVCVCVCARARACACGQLLSWY
jgi:hypothetical protein